VVVGVVDLDRHGWPAGQTRLPAGQVAIDGHLVVAAALQDQHRLVKRGRDTNLVVVAQVKPVRGGPAEKQARGRRRG